MRLFGAGTDVAPLVLPAPSLARPQARETVEACFAQNRATVAFFQEKLGGEISLPGTSRSPEMAFDFTLVHLVPGGRHIAIGQFGILEVQTMDFHGSYRHSVQNLRDALRLHREGFHHALTNNPQWASEKIEGPNKSNVFKRTFYQLVFKFRLGMHAACAGCVLALPTAVWDSWQPHLGAPRLLETGEHMRQLAQLGGSSPAGVPNDSRCWIYVIEPDPLATESPNPVVIRNTIATNADVLSHYALHEAPDAAMEGVGAIVGRIRARLAERLGEPVA